MVFPCYVLKGIEWSRRAALSVFFLKRQQFIIFARSKHFRKFERAPFEVLQEFRSSRPFDTLTGEGFVRSWRIFFLSKNGWS